MQEPFTKRQQTPPRKQAPPEKQQTSEKMFFYTVLAGGIALLLLTVLAAVAFFTGQSTENRTLSGTTQPKTVGIVQFLGILEPSIQGFKDTMATQGYREGENITYLQQSANGNFAMLAEITQDYIDQNVDLIFADSPESGSIALQVTQETGRQDIPIVFVNATDPVRAGLIQDFRSSGNNTTGIAIDFVDLTARKLDFLQRIDPNIEKIAVVYNLVSDPTADAMLEELHRQAARLNLEVIQYDIENPPGPESTAESAELINNEMQPGDFDAYFHLAGPVVNFPDNQQLLMQIGQKFQVPSVYLQNFAPTDNWLFSYGHDLHGTGAQAAPMAHKIFNGTRPTDIPIEYQDEDLIVVNLRAANEIGVTLPASLLEIADVRIEE